MRFVEIDLSRLRQYEGLFRSCFPKAQHLNFEYLRWLYFRNPVGSVAGFDAIVENEVVAHYACLPVEYLIDNRVSRGLLSLNTATHPKYQGQGLFTKLANLTYESAQSLGFGYVIGVANAQSTPGFISKLGFSLLAPLDAFCFIPRQMVEMSEKISFVRNWVSETLRWRLENPAAAYLIHTEGVVSARSTVRGVRVFSNLQVTPLTFESARLVGFGLIPGVFLGFPTFKATHISIPDFLKPSPLNFIVKHLASNELVGRDTSEMKFDFLDFDGF